MIKYVKSECHVFAKTGRAFGELSNIHSKFKIQWKDIEIPSSEHLYQMLRYSHLPEIQRGILSEPRPMGSKFKAYETIEQTREDWMQIRLPVMTWVVKVKLCQHIERLSAILLEEPDKAIVEYSKSDNFWGAVKQSDGTLLGHNYLGRIWMQARRCIEDGSVIDLSIPGVDLSLLGERLKLADFKLDKVVRTASL